MAEEPKGGLSLSLPPELENHPKYRIVSVLGQGSMGAVYKAEHTTMERPVAIKVIHSHLLTHPDALLRFLAEVRAAARLDHPNIVKAYDTEQVGGVHFLVMEFVEGATLDAMLAKKGAMPIQLACQLLSQAALGLQHAHEQGLAHRDIKPANLILTRKGVVKILDFGLAKQSGESPATRNLTKMNAYMGTAEYVAPEQAMDARKADIRSDVYSLGCVAYEMLAGQPPFTGETSVQLIMAHLDNAPQPLPERRRDVPEALWRVIARMLAKDPAQRFQSPSEVVRALQPFAREGGKPAVPPPLPPPPPPPVGATGPCRGEGRPRSATPEACGSSRPVQRGQDDAAQGCAGCARRPKARGKRAGRANRHGSQVSPGERFSSPAWQVCC